MTLVVGAIAVVIVIGLWVVMKNTTSKNADTMMPTETIPAQGSASEEQTENAGESMMENTNQGAMENSATDASTPESTAMMQGSIQIEGGTYYFAPDTITVKKGEPVTITFTSAGGMHDFVIDEFNVRTKRVSEGESDTVMFTPDKAGTYEFYCSVGNHRQMGMKGTLVVE